MEPMRDERGKSDSTGVDSSDDSTNVHDHAYPEAGPAEEFDLIRMVLFMLALFGVSVLLLPINPSLALGVLIGIPALLLISMALTSKKQPTVRR